MDGRSSAGFPYRATAPRIDFATYAKYSTISTMLTPMAGDEV
jgi:hypothetical protein